MTSTRFYFFIILSCVITLSACTASTHIKSADSEAQLRINDDPAITIPTETPKTYPTTSFGQYKFKLSKEGTAPMYGIMPLKFNGGYLAADILLFAPAAFFNLREVFPFYEFDLAQGEIRYKKKEQDTWTVYKPTPAEAEHAKHYFGE